MCANYGAHTFTCRVYVSIKHFNWNLEIRLEGNVNTHSLFALYRVCTWQYGMEALNDSLKTEHSTYISV